MCEEVGRGWGGEGHPHATPTSINTYVSSQIQELNRQNINSNLWKTSSSADYVDARHTKVLSLIPIVKLDHGDCNIVKCTQTIYTHSHTHLTTVMLLVLETDSNFKIDHSFGW